MSIEQTFDKWAKDASQSLSGATVSVFGLCGSYSADTRLEYFKLHGTTDSVEYDTLHGSILPIMKGKTAVMPFILPANIGVSWIGTEQYAGYKPTIFLEFILHSAITPVVSTTILNQPEIGSIRDDIYDLVCDSGRWNTEEEAVRGIVKSISPKIYHLVQASSPVPLESLMTADLF